MNKKLMHKKKEKNKVILSEFLEHINFLKKNGKEI